MLTELHQIYCFLCPKSSATPPTRARFHLPCPDLGQQHMVLQGPFCCPSILGAQPLKIWCSWNTVSEARWLLWERQHFEIQAMAPLKSGPYGLPPRTLAMLHTPCHSCLHEEERSPGEIFWKDRSFIIPQLPSLSCCLCASVTLSRTLSPCLSWIH